MTIGDAESSPTRIILGPTAAGKSALAMQLAARYGLSIVSADSRQVYAGFDIGTGKPTADERRNVPHYGLDVIEPTVRYSAHQWATDAVEWMSESRGLGREPVIVGGTGFYVRALADPLDESPALDASRRTALEPWLASLDAQELERWCRRLDPERAALGRTQRLRAVETALLTGTRISASHEAAVKDTRPLVGVVRYLVVDPGPVLASRIGDRVAAMIATGWIEEVRTLLARVPVDAPAWKGCGYATLRDAVVRGTNLDEAMQRVVIETRQYAKRQRTWNRHQLPAERVTRVDSSAADAFDRACAWWESDDGEHT
jgi:tRNA dimethylallyltransferase